MKLTQGLVLVVLLMLSAFRSFAAVEGVYAVQQPILTGMKGIRARPVLIATLCDLWSYPGWAVDRTVAENCIWTDQGFQDRNAAHVAGLEVSLVPHKEPSEGRAFRGLFGDTLRVRLDVADAVHARDEGSLDLFGWSLDEVVSLTCACIRANAEREHPRVRYLELEVVGSDEYAGLGGVFVVEPPAGRAE